MSIWTGTSCTMRRQYLTTCLALAVSKTNLCGVEHTPTMTQVGSDAFMTRCFIIGHQVRSSIASSENTARSTSSNLTNMLMVTDDDTASCLYMPHTFSVQR